MNDDFSHMMTPFDQYISNQSLQMTKLLIPFLPPQSQRMIAVYVKFLEFRHTISFFRNMRQRTSSPEDVFDGLKPYLSPSDLESFDQMQNMMNMMSMMQEMQNMSGMDFDPMSMMGMFAQEEHTESQKEGETNVGLDDQSVIEKYGSDQVGTD